MSENHRPHLFTIQAGLPVVVAILCSVSVTGCSMSFWKTAEAAEETAVETVPEGDAADLKDADAAEGPAAAGAAENQSSKQDMKTAAESDRTSSVALSEKSVSVESQLETLRTSLSRTASYRKLRTKKTRESFVKEAELQIDIGLAAVDAIVSAPAAELSERREAWKGRFTLLNRGKYLKLPEFGNRLDKAVAEATTLPEFETEAEYGSGLVLVNRLFKSGNLQETLEQLQTHAREFPDGASSARLFLTFARNCGEQGKFGAGILCCNLALWQLNNHPDIGAVRNLLENLQAGRTVDPSQDKVQQLLEKEVSVLRHALPIRIDGVTTCTAITTDYHAVSYSLRVTLSPSFVKANEDKLRESITKMARTTFQTQHLLDQGVSLHYVYFDSDGQELLRFTVNN